MDAFATPPAADRAAATGPVQPCVLLVMASASRRQDALRLVQRLAPRIRCIPCTDEAQVLFDGAGADAELIVLEAEQLRLQGPGWLSLLRRLAPRARVLSLTGDAAADNRLLAEALAVRPGAAGAPGSP